MAADVKWAENVTAIPTQAMATFTSSNVAVDGPVDQTVLVTGFFSRVSAVLEAFAQALPFVDEAWLRVDGTEFVLIGREWIAEGDERAADLSVALQRSLAPNYDVHLHGGFQPRCEQPLDGFTRVFVR